MAYFCLFQHTNMELTLMLTGLMLAEEIQDAQLHFKAPLLPFTILLIV